MRSRPLAPRRRRRTLLTALAAWLLTPAVVLLAGAGAGAGAGPGAGASRALAQGLPALTPQTDASVPAHELLMLGSSPGEAPNETWAVGKVGAQSRATWAIVRYSSGAGWSLAPAITDGAGNPLSGFVPVDSPLAGSVTPDGSGALLGSVPVGSEQREALLVRAPGQAFSETSSEAPLEPGERLYDPDQRRAPMVAALEEGAGAAGALVLPVAGASAAEEDTVLHWSGVTRAWTTEPIEIPAASRGGARVLAIGASSSANAWLLMQLQGGLALFRREETGAGGVWQPVSPGSGEPAGAPLQVPLAAGASTPLTLEGAGEPPTNDSQLLTVSSQGVWIDGERLDTRASTTMFFKPETADGGTVLASWCDVSTAPTCTHPLPEPLPSGPSRSFAWGSTSPFGERVITGFAEGVSLSLAGEVFTRVLALGSSATFDVGGSHGAAFSTPTEGWLGSGKLPVHLTEAPGPNLLQNYPVPFRHPLLAIAPQPGASVGSLSSAALAVGEAGEVTRYQPNVGWQPESLLNVAGVRQTPQLRAVAWPTPARAYAVGTAGQMWLWRGETNLWEKDPATPVNFRGDLLGVAFDPADTSRGYAVGQGGVLLRYGKTWTQEPTCPAGVTGACLPEEVAAASFTSIAFAGSEAIVAFRIPHFSFTGEGSSFSYSGGLLVNSGGGWHVDAAAAAALAAEPQDIPWAVAALPDGGAAMSAESGPGVARVFERNAAGAAWEPTPQPYPGYAAPGALALFREAGVLRVIGSGAVPRTEHADEQTPPPAGFPPALVRPYPLAEPPAFLLRQTASGWSDEEHDHDEVGPPQGNYKQYDKGYEPDPSWAVLIGPTGSPGWAVGGFPKGEEEGSGFETADVFRYAYPTPETAPVPGAGKAAIGVEAGKTAFAIGGGSQCGAPCAARAKARIGPDAWLASAVNEANAIAGVKAFLYTGPRLTTGATLVKPTLEVPYTDEAARYAELLAGGQGLSAYPAASPTDRVGESECLFTQTFSFLPFADAGSCATGQGAYYTLTEENVQVLVADDGGPIETAQVEWLTRELALASSGGHPAIVVGNADLNQRAEHEEGARALVRAIVAGKAAAYFFDAPEQNIRVELPGSAIPAYGSGTLGYVSVQHSELPEFIGASGFLLAAVGKFEGQAPAGQPNARVTAKLIPDIEGEDGDGELALEAKQGTLLRRSQVAAFAGLARRPRAGNEAFGESESERFSYVFTPIPANCVGADCPQSGGAGILPEYSFTSSNEEVGRFVQQELKSAEPDAVKFNEKTGEPEFEGGAKPSQGLPYASKSGLFCALNKGSTTITISAGGFYASLPITVQAGSVRRPCGTTPLKHLPVQEQKIGAPAAPPPAPVPAGAPAAAPPILPVPPAPVPPAAVTPPAPPRAAALPTPFFVQPAPPFIIAPFVPPPLPAPANPTPPSGTSAVTSPVEAAQKEEEQEEATESVSNQAVAYRTDEHEPAAAYILGIILLAAFAGAAGARRRPRRGEREIRVAPATLSTMRAQRSLSARRRRW